jgi:hypothetical protein
LIDQPEPAPVEQFHEAAQVNEEDVECLVGRPVRERNTLPPAVDQALVVEIGDDLILRLRRPPQRDQPALRLACRSSNCAKNVRA